MLALWKKNCWRFGWGGAVVLGLAAALGVACPFIPWADGVFDFLPLVAALAGSVVGLACFHVDAQGQALRFLEGLPLRRLRIWAANALFGLAVSLIGLLLLAGPYTWHWAPVSAGPVIRSQHYGEAYICATRWSMVVGLGSILVAGLAVSVFFRSFHVSEKGGVLASCGAPVGMFIAGCFLLGWTWLAPSMLEVAGLALGIGLIFAVAGWLANALAPERWTALRHAAAVGLPLLLAALVASAGFFVAMAGHWARLDRGEELAITGAYVRPEAPSVVFPWVRSQRSGPHLFAVEVESGAHHEVGRLVSPVQVLPGAPARLGYWSLARWGGVFRAGPTLATIRVDGGDYREWAHVPSPGPLGRIGSEEYYGDASWTADGRWLMRLTTDEPAQPYAGWLRIMDAQGRERYRVAVETFGTGGRPWKVDRECRRVVMAAPMHDSYFHTTGPPEYMLLDLATGRRRRFTAPGQMLRFTDDLGLAILLRKTEREGFTYPTLVAVETGTGRERVVLPEGALPRSASQAQPAMLMAEPAGWGSEASMPVGNVGVWFDASGRQAAWLAVRAEGGTRWPSLHYVEVETGEQRVLAPEGRLPALEPGKEAIDGAGLRADCRFTADGKEFIYFEHRAIVSVGVRDGVRRVLCPELGDGAGAGAGPGAGTWYGWQQVSPSGRRVVCVEQRAGGPGVGEVRGWWGEPGAEGSAEVPGAGAGGPGVSPGGGGGGGGRVLTRVMVWTQGKGASVFSTEGGGSFAYWLDDERVILPGEKAVWVINADGSGARRIFGVPEDVGE